MRWQTIGLLRFPGPTVRKSYSTRWQLTGIYCFRKIHFENFASVQRPVWLARARAHPTLWESYYLHVWMRYRKFEGTFKVGAFFWRQMLTDAAHFLRTVPAGLLLLKYEDAVLKQLVTQTMQPMLDRLNSQYVRARKSAFFVRRVYNSRFAVWCKPTPNSPPTTHRRITWLMCRARNKVRYGLHSWPLRSPHNDTHEMHHPPAQSRKNPQFRAKDPKIFAPFGSCFIVYDRWRFQGIDYSAFLETSVYDLIVLSFQRGLIRQRSSADSICTHANRITSPSLQQHGFLALSVAITFIYVRIEKVAASAVITDRCWLMGGTLDKEC